MNIKIVASVLLISVSPAIAHDEHDPSVRYFITEDGVLMHEHPLAPNDPIRQKPDGAVVKPPHQHCVKQGDCIVCRDDPVKK